MNRKLRIGITDCGKYENYRRWIESSGTAEAVKLSASLNNPEAVAGCDGVLLSGGEDVHPELYGKPEYVKAFELKEIIPERDRFEMTVIKNALEQGRPLLGICRGLQIANVYLGGTLVPDIPTVLHSVFHSKIDGVDQLHPVDISPGSLLEQISGLDSGMVNSAHHQSVDRPGPDLKVTAFSDAGIVEAMEWSDPEERSWLLLVQWHPERMQDQDSPLTNQVRKAFLEAADIRQTV
ncbi:MAG: gamma-glutamyl-gamma-aminobutyrate hydrolase family protein [Bacteroidota bacterium]|nr:gamma-glutamyl-gamma-aminobutyrate hydrolase family protein [Bacteroidota bacterium]